MTELLTGLTGEDRICRCLRFLERDRAGSIPLNTLGNGYTSFGHIFRRENVQKSGLVGTYGSVFYCLGRLSFRGRLDTIPCTIVWGGSIPLPSVSDGFDSRWGRRNFPPSKTFSSMSYRNEKIPLEGLTEMGELGQDHV